MLITILILLISANAAPILARQLFGRHFSLPVDSGLRLSDGQALFGPSKTWRGIVSAILITCLLGVILGVDWQAGMMIGLLVMCGDLLASFIKRRMQLAASAKAPLLDQLPEVILPLVYLQWLYDLSLLDILFVTLAFVIIETGISPVLYVLHIRKRPY